MSAGGGFSAGGNSSFGGDLDVTGTIETLMPTKITPGTAQPPLILGPNAQGQFVQGFNSDQLDGLHASAFVQREANGTISAVHTFNPLSVGPAFNLGANAKGQWIDGFNADYLDGVHASVFMKLGTAQTVTVAHTFNPAVAGAPFALGANASGQLVQGFNADQLDGLDSSVFVQKATAATITAVHSFSPATASAPFTLGANAQGRTVTGLDADTLDGNHASAFVTSGALSNYLTLSGGILSGMLTAPTYKTSGTYPWTVSSPGNDFEIRSPSNEVIARWSRTDGKLFNIGGADFGNIVYSYGFNSAYYSGDGSFAAVNIGVGSSCRIERNASDYFIFKGASGSTVAAFNRSFFLTYSPELKVAEGGPTGQLYAYTIHTHNTIQYNMTVDTSKAGNDKWDMVTKAVDAYSKHDASKMHAELKVEHPSNKGMFGYKITDLLQIAVECIADLRAEIDLLKGKA
jgi:hypothetical protein